MAKSSGHNWSVVFNSSGLSLDVRSVTPPQPNRPEIDFTDLSSTDYMDFEPGDLSDPGTLTITAFFDPSVSIPVNSDAETINVNFGSSAGDPKWTFTGWIQDYQPQSSTFNEAAMVQINVRVKGAITIDTQ